MKQAKGFTLIEMLITVAVLGIITTIAVSSYQGSLLRQQREVAKAELVRLAQSQVAWRVTHSAYAAVASLGAKPIEYYAFTDGTPSSESDFLIKATASGSQINDSGCTELQITKSGLITPAGC